MIHLKSQEEIELLRASNMLVSRTLAEVARLIAPGVTTLRLDQVAEEFIRDHDGVPAFLGYKGYPKTLCTSLNHEVVHGIPSTCTLKEGDIVSVDCGVVLNGYYGDSAYTFAVGSIPHKVRLLLASTRESLFKGIEQAVIGRRVGDISHAVQEYCEDRGFSIVRDLVGHGIGKSLHEPPEVPNYGKKGQGVRLKKGMTLCIEPMVNMGRKEIAYGKDGWTVRTADQLPSAHYELCVAIVPDGPDILSTFGFIEEVYNDAP